MRSLVTICLLSIAATTCGQQVLIEMTHAPDRPTQPERRPSHPFAQEFGLNHELLSLDLEKRQILARQMIGTDPIVAYSPEGKGIWFWEPYSSKTGTHLRKLDLPRLDVKQSYDHVYPFGFGEAVPVDESRLMVIAYEKGRERDKTRDFIALIDARAGQMKELFPLPRTVIGKSLIIDAGRWRLFPIDHQRVLALRYRAKDFISGGTEGEDFQKAHEKWYREPQLVGSGIIFRWTGEQWETDEYDGLNALKKVRLSFYLNDVAVVPRVNLLLGLWGPEIIMRNLFGVAEPEFREVDLKPMLHLPEKPQHTPGWFAVDSTGSTACILFYGLRGFDEPVSYFLVWVDLRQGKVINSAEVPLLSAYCQVNDSLTVVAQGANLTRYRSGQLVKEEPFRLSGRRIVKIWPVAAGP